MSRKNNVIILFFATLAVSHLTAFGFTTNYWYIGPICLIALGYLTLHELDIWEREKNANK